MKIGIVLYGDVKYAAHQPEYLKGFLKKNKAYSISSSDQYNTLNNKNRILVGNKFSNELLDRLYFSIKVIQIALSLKLDILIVSYGRLIFPIGLFFRLANLFRHDQKVTTYYYLRSGSVSGNFDNIKNWFHKFESYFFDHILLMSRRLGLQVYGNIPRNSFVVDVGGSLDDHKKISETEEALKNNFTRSFNLVYIGVFTSRNLHVMLDQIDFDTSDFNIILIGYGDEGSMKKLEEAIAKKQIQNNVSFIGFVPFQELKRWIELADLGIAYVPEIDMYQHQPSFKLFQYLYHKVPALITMTEYNKEIYDKIQPYTVVMQDQIKLTSMIKEANKAKELLNKRPHVVSSWGEVVDGLEQYILATKHN